MNECADNNGGCEQDCVNQAGSFQCQCVQGFNISSDGQSCEGNM